MQDKLATLVNTFFCIFIIIILVIVFPIYDDLKGSFIFEANKALSVEGIVLSSEVIESVKYRKNQDDILIFEPKIRYEYFVENQKYVNEKIFFASTEYENISDAKYYVGKYHKLSKVNVFYIAGDAQFSVLEPNINSKEFFISLSLFSFLITALYFFWSYKFYSTKRT